MAEKRIYSLFRLICSNYESRIMKLFVRVEIADWID